MPSNQESILLWSVRVCFIALLLVGLALIVRWRRGKLVRQFFFARIPAFNLGLLRIVIFGSLLDGAISENSVWYAGLPSSLLRIPPGWRWLASYLPPNEAVLQLFQLILVVACVFAIMGLFTRLACGSAALAGLVVLGVPNLYIKINHGQHLTELCAILLTFSPADEGLSLDQLLRRLRGAPAAVPSPRYGVPVRMAMLLLASTYFFPGLWKVWDSGDLWVNGVKLRVETLMAWAARPDYQPLLRLIDHPALCCLLGAWALAFELGFALMIFHPLGRIVAVANALAFHAGVRMTMGIQFPLLLPLLAALSFGEQREAGPSHALQRLNLLVEGGISQVRNQLRVRLQGRVWPIPQQAPATTWLVGCGLVASMVLAGLVPFDSWPVGVYPRFSTRFTQPPDRGRLVEFAIEREQGSINLGSRLGLFDSARSTQLARGILRAAARGEPWLQYISPVGHVIYHGRATPQPGDVLSIVEVTWPLDSTLPRAFERKTLARFAVPSVPGDASAQTWAGN
jgi:HTTM domain